MIGIIIIAMIAIAALWFASTAIEGASDLIASFFNSWVLIPLAIGIIAITYLYTRKIDLDLAKRTTKLMAIAFTALFLILFVGPTIADGTIGQPHYTLKGNIQLDAGLLGQWPPILTISNIHNTPTGMVSITNVDTPYELTCVNCGGTVEIIAEGPVTKSMQRTWAIGWIPGLDLWSTNFDFSVPGLVPGNYILYVGVTEASTGQIISQTFNITIP